MKYDIYMCIQNIDDYYNTIYEKNIEVKNKKEKRNKNNREYKDTMAYLDFVKDDIQKNNELSSVIKFLGENPGACPWDEAKKYFSKSLMSISSEYTLQI